MKSLRFVNISPFASGNPSAGHWYWVHSELANFEDSLSFSKINSTAEYARNLLKGSYSYDKQNSITAYRDASVIKKSLKSENGPFLFHIYEGNLQSILLAALLLRKDKFSKVLVNLHWADLAAIEFDSSKKSANQFYRQLKFLIEIFNKQLILTAESEKLAKLISIKLSSKIIEYEVFSVHNEIGSDAKIKDIAVLGSPSSRTSFYELIEAVEKILTRNEKVVLNIPTHLLGQEISDLDLSNAESAGIEVFCSNLSREEYARLGERAKVTVLTYNSSFYEWGSSGKLLDSIKFGSRVVLPDNCAMAEKVKENNWGSTFDFGDKMSLSKAIEIELEKRPDTMNFKMSSGIEEFKSFLVQFDNLLDSKIRKTTGYSVFRENIIKNYQIIRFNIYLRVFQRNLVTNKT